jgi:hypothetical protein
MFCALRHAALAALLPLTFGACAPSLPRMAPSFGLLDAGPAAPVRGDAPLFEEKAPSVARAEAPSHEPLPLERGSRCGATPGEQARAQCLRGSNPGGSAQP